MAQSGIEKGTPDKGNSGNGWKKAGLIGLGTVLGVLLSLNFSAIAQREAILLEGGEGLGLGGLAPDLDVVRTVVAHHTAPQRVVEVEHQHFLGPRVRRPPGGAEAGQIIRQPLLIEIQFRRIVELTWREPARANLVRQRFHIQPGDDAAAGLQQFIVQ